MDDEFFKEFLAESWESLERLDQQVIALEKCPRDEQRLAAIFRTVHSIKGACGSVGLTALGAVAHSTEGVLEHLRDGHLTGAPATISLVLEAVDAIRQLLRAVESSGKEPPHDVSDLIARLDRLADQRAEVRGGEEWHRSRVAGHRQVPEEAGANEPMRSEVGLSVRVDLEVLDRLADLTGELDSTRNQLLRLSHGDRESRFAAPLAQLDRVTTDLKDTVLKIRMQPVGHAWSKLPRLVRDLALQTGKLIELETSGAETRIDRTILDAIRDPLTHIVRNCADHGIESPAARRAAGKPESGRIRLSAGREGTHVVVSIKDDGAGIRIEKVRERAVRSGLVPALDAARLSDREVLKFVFLPGFSTAESLTTVSGRGVGMDVVKVQVERIGGSVEISTWPGEGTTVRIRVPARLRGL